MRQPQIGLVHQGCALQGVAGTLLSQAVVRDAL
jgi:hypothetical protein